MADYVIIDSITIPLPAGYVFEPIKLETNERTLDGTLITNYSVDSEDVAVTKCRFELSGIFQFPSSFSGSTSSSNISLQSLGIIYVMHLISERYELIRISPTGDNIARYTLILEEV